MVGVRVPRVWFVCACVLSVFVGWPSRALAQPTVNPTQAQFTPSADQNATLPDGTPIVQSYQLGLFLSGAQAPFQTVPLGKPAPSSDGLIHVDLTSVFVGWPVAGTVYVADVAAVGPGGSSQSPFSNTFVFEPTCTFSASPTSQSL